jgi:predicted dehydrogenase
MQTYRAAVIGCSRMGAFIDNEGVAHLASEITDYLAHNFPKSHAASFFADERTDLIACSDLRTEVMAEFGQRYKVPADRQYTNYQEMLEKEQPDIVSVTTQPEQRAEVVIYAAEHGVKAIYAEKAMAASMDEADAMVEAVERNSVAFNLGTNRRWDTGFDKMKEIIDSGELGALRTLIIYGNGSLFNTASHNFDLILRLNSDAPASWVSAHLPDGDKIIDGNIVREDPSGHGIIQFSNGVTAHALLAQLGWEAICEKGSIASSRDGAMWQIRRENRLESFPRFERTSSGANIVKDLVHALDTGKPTRGGVRVAHASTELIFAFMESHLRNGARVNLPLKGSKLRLQRDRGPRQPRFEP